MEFRPRETRRPDVHHQGPEEVAELKTRSEVADLPTQDKWVLAPGEWVGGSFEVQGLLGAGGMAQVFAAEDHGLCRTVALKVGLQTSSSDTLRHEARALAAVRHTSLCSVHALIEHRGFDIIVMERLYGLTLRQQAKSRRRAGRPFRVDEVLELIAGLADGLAAVHRAGLVHRDIKPGNVMLPPDGRVVLTDFGLVLPQKEIGVQDVLAGSPPYMAPESIRNEVASGEAPLVDIFALGVVAYELLAGNRPWPYREIQDLANAFENEKPVDLGSIRSDAPRALLELVHAMIAINAADRPPSAEGIAWQLRALRTHTPSRPPAAPSAYPSVPPIEVPQNVLRELDVLVVDDDDAIAKVAQFYTGKAVGGHAHFRRARDGEEAVRMFAEQPPDLMLLDLHMPRMNGIEVCMHIRGEREASECRIVCVSAGAQPEDIRLLSQLGMHHFVPKGLEMKAELEVVLRQLFPLHAGPARQSLLPPK